MLRLTLPRASYLIYYFAMVIGTSGVRFSYVILNTLNEKMADLTGGNKKMINVMLIGAGAAGSSILKEIEESRYLNLKVKCIIDDNPAKQGKYLRGVPIVGTREDIPDKVKSIISRRSL